jgi:hypothetical protein
MPTAEGTRSRTAQLGPLRSALLVGSVIAVAAAGSAGCAGSTSAGSNGSLASPTLTPAPPPAARDTGATAPVSVAAQSSVQGLGDRVFALAAHNRARLGQLLVTPSSVPGLTCVAIYSNAGEALAARTQDADMSQLPVPGTPTALISACKRGDTIVQIAADSVTNAHHDTVVLDDPPVITLGHGNANGSDLRTTHHVTQQALLSNADTALQHLEQLLGLST